MYRDYYSFFGVCVGNVVIIRAHNVGQEVLVGMALKGEKEEEEKRQQHSIWANGWEWVGMGTIF